METFAYIMGVMTTLFWILMCVFSLVSYHRDWSLWAACIAVLCLVIGAFAWYQDLLWKGDAEARRLETQNKVVATQSTVNTLTPEAPQITPGEIYEQLNRALPFQRDGIAKQFVGARINWKLSLYQVMTDPEGKRVAAFRDTGADSSDLHIVSFTVSDEDVPSLRTAKQGSLFTVTGKIKRVWLFIDLEEASIVPIAR